MVFGDFWMDAPRLPTNTKTFIDATGYQPANSQLDHWRGGKTTAGMEDHPRLCSLNDARAYAAGREAFTN